MGFGSEEFLNFFENRTEAFKFLPYGLMSTPIEPPNHDNKPGWRTWLVVGSVPLGAIMGFVLGGQICQWILELQGRGHSHGDAIPVVASGVLGAIVGPLILPLIVWLLVRNR